MIIHVLVWYRRCCLRTLPSSVGYVGCIQDSTTRVFPGRVPDMRANTPDNCMKACLRKGEHSNNFLFMTISKDTQKEFTWVSFGASNSKSVQIYLMSILKHSWLFLCRRLAKCWWFSLKFLIVLKQRYTCSLFNIKYLFTYINVLYHIHFDMVFSRLFQKERITSTIHLISNMC